MPKSSHTYIYYGATEEALAEKYLRGKHLPSVHICAGCGSLIDGRCEEVFGVCFTCFESCEFCRKPANKCECPWPHGPN